MVHKNGNVSWYCHLAQIQAGPRTYCEFSFVLRSHYRWMTPPSASRPLTRRRGAIAVPSILCDHVRPSRRVPGSGWRSKGWSRFTWEVEPGFPSDAETSAEKQRAARGGWEPLGWTWHLYTFIRLYIFVYLFMCSFICLFVCSFVHCFF